MAARLRALAALVHDGVLAGRAEVLAGANGPGASLAFALDVTVLARALDALLLAVRRQHRVELLPVFVHVRVVRAAAVGEDRLRIPERSGASARLVALFAGRSRARGFGFDDLRANFAAGLLVRAVGDLVAAVKGWTLRPRTVDFERVGVAGADDAGVVPVRG